MTFADAIQEHTQHAKKYFQNVIRHLSTDCKDYWLEFSSPRLDPLPPTSIFDTSPPSNIGNRAAQVSTEHQPPTHERNENNSTIENDQEQSRQGATQGQQSDSHSRDTSSSFNTISQASNTNVLSEPSTSTIDNPQRYPDYSHITGISCPGRPKYRPLIMFDQLEGHQCGKRYALNTNHSPGLLIAQCACANPKFIAYIIMTRAESTSLALALMIMHFLIPPEIILHENA